DAVARLQASLDPGIAALQRYEQAQEDVARAVALGAISQEEANRTLALARARYEAAGQAALASGRRVEQSLQVTGYQVQNLAFQFQDIGVMLASGQSPLLLAVQQGSQIAQMLGPMGAAGAVRALAQGFMGFFSPVTLITVGSIAAGAAMIQWLTKAGEKAESLEDRLQGIADAVENYRAAVDAASRSDIDLMNTFGGDL
ncbi:MAG: phage tail length tape measure family protein, partial [Rhodocyclaceae bacterium]|nr:phage tail length tape measure family protein [Rhodocyclaceae bacterium]